MEKLITCICAFFSILTFCHAQSYNLDNVALANYLQRMYEAEPFDGVKIIRDYSNTYLVSFITLDDSSNEQEQSIVSRSKALADISRYLNGAQISSDQIIRISEKDGKKVTKIIEEIKSHSAAYVKTVELLTVFKTSSSTKVFIYIQRITTSKGRKR